MAPFILFCMLQAFTQYTGYTAQVIVYTVNFTVTIRAHTDLFQVADAAGPDGLH